MRNYQEIKLATIQIISAPSDSNMSWAVGKSFKIPIESINSSKLARDIDSKGNLIIKNKSYDINIEALFSLRTHSAFTYKRPWSSKLPFSYQKFPSWVRSLYAFLVGLWNRRAIENWATFPRWPLDLSADFLLDIISKKPSLYSSEPTPVLLTHDLDSIEGMRNLIKMFLPLEESVGAKSINFIVPQACKIDYSFLDNIKSRGHEIGIHGYNHSNTTAFVSQHERMKRLLLIKDIIKLYDIKGYRSPSLLRTRELFKDLSQIYLYDSSIPTSGGLFPVPNNGCATARPFVIENIIELPLSMPRDGSLLFLGHSPQEILNIWVKSADEISLSGGVVVLLTHCESRFTGNAKMFDIYCKFIDYINNSGKFTWSNPEKVLNIMRSASSELYDNGCMLYE